MLIPCAGTELVTRKAPDIRTWILAGVQVKTVVFGRVCLAERRVWSVQLVVQIISAHMCSNKRKIMHIPAATPFREAFSRTQNNTCGD